VRATARRGSTRWTAEIDLEVAGEGEPSAIDFIALMREHRDPASAGPLELTACRVTPTRRDVEVEIRGADAVGFLGRILLVFAELGLYPHAMRVETSGAAVRDVFLLQDATGAPPSLPLVAALKRRLEGLVAAE
jgi:UTP:GlnB (protein PII) uridylyltransferase